MHQRRYLVPAVGALGLSMTAACNDPIIGDWRLKSLTNDGDTTAFPYTYTYTYNSTTYTFESNIWLEIYSGFTGELTTVYTYTKGDEEPVVYTYSYGLTVTSPAKKSYNIVVTDLDLDMDCTRDKKTLTCTEPGIEQLVFNKE